MARTSTKVSKKSAAKPAAKKPAAKAAKAKKWVYLYFDPTEVAAAEKYAGGTTDGTRSLLGGKGFGLADMARRGLPVPPGFTVTTEACNAYLAAGEKLPKGMWDQELAALKEIERITGKGFGDA